MIGAALRTARPLPSIRLLLAGAGAGAAAGSVNLIATPIVLVLPQLNAETCRRLPLAKNPYCGLAVGGMSRAIAEGAGEGVSTLDRMKTA